MALPGTFLARMQATLGQEFNNFVHAHEQEPPISLRINPAKIADSESNAQIVPWTYSGKYIPQRPVFALDPRWHAGAYYVQEASSMFVEQAFQIVASQLEKPPVVLDLCAAPGGKSTHLATLLPAGGLLVSNEVIRARAQILAENLTSGNGQCHRNQQRPQCLWKIGRHV